MNQSVVMTVSSMVKVPDPASGCSSNVRGSYPLINGSDGRRQRGRFLGVIVLIVSQACCVLEAVKRSISHTSTRWRCRRGRCNLRMVSRRARRGLLNMRLPDQGLHEMKLKLCAICRRPRRGLISMRLPVGDLEWAC